MADDAEFQSQVLYRDTIVKLGEFHKDPCKYYAEARLDTHDQMMKTINSKNKF